jgi:hypothetical protein
MRNSFGLQTKRYNEWLTGQAHNRGCLAGSRENRSQKLTLKIAKPFGEFNVKLRHNGPGQPIAIGLKLMARVCTPGANIQAVFYRISMLTLLTYFAPDRLSP